MNILVYIPFLSQQNGGSRQYSVGLLKLIAEDTVNKYFIYHNNNDDEVLEIIKLHPHLQVIKDADVNHKPENYFSKKIRQFQDKLVAKLRLGKQKQKKSFIDTL